jgi:hypothetical protein
MAKTWPAKDPQDVSDHGFDWSPLIGMGDGPEDDPIVTATAEVVTGDVVIDSMESGYVEGAPTGQATVTWLSGGTAGTRYEIRMHIVTAAGREFDQTMKSKIKDR